MPLYDYACKKCGFIIRDLYFRLDERKDIMQLLCSKDGLTDFDQILLPVAVDDWGNCSEGKLFEDLAPRGLRFRDKRSFKEYLRRNGLRELNSYD